MDIKVIPLSELQADPPGVLAECCDSGDAVVVELPDHRFVAIHCLDTADEDDTLINDLLEANADFRGLLERSRTAVRKPFPAS